jgi:rubredoxin
MHSITPLLANGVLYGAFIGMMVAAIIVAIIPVMRKKMGEARERAEAGIEPSIQRHSACPQCGSKKFTLAESKSPLAETGLFCAFEVKDRCCKQCGTVYHMLFPAAARWVLLLTGLPIAIAGVGLFFVEGEVIAPIMCIVVGLLVFALGLFLPKH